VRKSEELTVITKTYDLILWSCNHIGKFPRNHRFVLGERIERNLYDLLEILIRRKRMRVGSHFKLDNSALLASKGVMPRRRRGATGGFVFHVLNRSELFKKDGDYAAFEKVLREGLEWQPMRVLPHAQSLASGFVAAT